MVNAKDIEKKLRDHIDLMLKDLKAVEHVQLDELCRNGSAGLNDAHANYNDPELAYRPNTDDLETYIRAIHSVKADTKTTELIGDKDFKGFETKHHWDNRVEAYKVTLFKDGSFVDSEYADNAGEEIDRMKANIKADYYGLKQKETIEKNELQVGQMIKSNQDLRKPLTGTSEPISVAKGDTFCVGKIENVGGQKMYELNFITKDGRHTSSMYWSVKDMQGQLQAGKMELFAPQKAKQDRPLIENLQVFKETDKAVLVKLNDPAKAGEKLPHWLPKSQVSIKDGRVFAATDFIIKEKGLPLRSAAAENTGKRTK